MIFYTWFLPLLESTAPLLVKPPLDHVPPYFPSMAFTFWSAGPAEFGSGDRISGRDHFKMIIAIHTGFKYKSIASHPRQFAEPYCQVTDFLV